MAESVNLGRRLFMRGKIKSDAPRPIRPPWALAESEFANMCTRCSDCIDACPEQIISVGSGGYPEVDLGLGECTFCANCVDACDVAAFKSPVQNEYLPAEAWQLDIQINDKCLSNNGVVCRACEEGCDYEAVAFQIKTAGVAEPAISSDKCTGCGACITVCPVAAIQLTA